MSFRLFAGACTLSLIKLGNNERRKPIFTFSATSQPLCTFLSLPRSLSSLSRCRWFVVGCQGCVRGSHGTRWGRVPDKVTATNCQFLLRLLPSRSFSVYLSPRLSLLRGSRPSWGMRSVIECTVNNNKLSLAEPLTFHLLRLALRFPPPRLFRRSPPRSFRDPSSQVDGEPSLRASCARLFPWALCSWLVPSFSVASAREAS